jgi:hypothetical protein
MFAAAVQALECLGYQQANADNAAASFDGFELAIDDLPRTHLDKGKWNSSLRHLVASYLG